MKTTNTLPPVMPVRRPKDYNTWQQYITKSLNKSTGTDTLTRLRGVFTCAALFICLSVHAQTTQYTKIITTHFKAEKITSLTTKFEGGTVDLDAKLISIDKEAPKPHFYAIAQIGELEAEDEGYWSREYLCLEPTRSGNGFRGIKVVVFYAPDKKRITDVLVKTGHTNVDYCISDK